MLYEYDYVYELKTVTKPFLMYVISKNYQYLNELQVAVSL